MTIAPFGIDVLFAFSASMKSLPVVADTLSVIFLTHWDTDYSHEKKPKRS